jgi:hypothetical protein
MFAKIMVHIHAQIERQMNVCKYLLREQVLKFLYL